DSCGPLPPQECDLELPFIESQCAVRPVDPEDPKLTYWTKIEYPWLSLPPPSMGLAGWRDPYIIHRPGRDGHDCWSLLIGSGVKDNGGTVLLYTSRDLLDGWELHGELCHGRGNAATTGVMWECPILCKLDTRPSSATLMPHTKGRGHIDSSFSPSPVPVSGPGNSDGGSQDPLPHFFCVSPDACTNPAYYWLGPYDPVAKRFDIDSSVGPFKLDLGDVLYAPNTLEDTAKGRTLLWGWNQEKRTKVDAYDYSGCLSLPRVLWLEKISHEASAGSEASPSGAGGWALHQQPLPELSQLRIPHR
ncbi:hypothetical protein Agub_g8070, partial [Astrephomene gubernaculifera]